jgi:hypothetical protein
MSLETLTKHVAGKVGKTPISRDSFPHIYVQNIFPAGFYSQMIQNLPEFKYYIDLKTMNRVGAGYPDERGVLDLKSVKGLPANQYAFWKRVTGWLTGGEFGKVILSKFKSDLDTRFQNLKWPRMANEFLLVRDLPGYKLGPHSDSIKKVITVLFYLPKDWTGLEQGTSVYEPNDPSFICEGGPHHEFKKFKLVKTMPNLPNSMFAFVKTNKSFHGVEPTTRPRDLLLFDITVKK